MRVCVRVCVCGAKKLGNTFYDRFRYSLFMLCPKMERERERERERDRERERERKREREREIERVNE